MSLVLSVKQCLKFSLLIFASIRHKWHMYQVWHWLWNNLNWFQPLRNQLLASNFKYICWKTSRQLFAIIKMLACTIFFQYLGHCVLWCIGTSPTHLGSTNSTPTIFLGCLRATISKTLEIEVEVGPYFVNAGHIFLANLPRQQSSGKSAG